MKLSDIIPYTKNPRDNTEEAVAKVAKSITNYGFNQPIVLDSDNVIICGHTRYLAAQEIGLEEVPVLIADWLTPDQVKAYRIADNRVAQESKWDDDLLSEEMIALDAKGDLFTDLFVGFEPEELVGLLEPLLPDTEGDDEAPEADLDSDANSQLGEMYELGPHMLMCGDSTSEDDVSALMGGEKADMLFTDPPYGISIIGGDKPFGSKANIGNMRGEIVEAGSYAPIIGDDTIDAAVRAHEIAAAMNIKQIILWGGQYYAHQLPPAKCWLIWDKETDGSLGDGEIAWTNIDRAVKIYRHKWSGMIKASEHGQRRVHPTQKPIALAEFAFNEFKAGDIILDLFGGSGSTLIACAKTNRICRMMELSPHYCDVIRKRWTKWATENGQDVGTGGL